MPKKLDAIHYLLILLLIGAGIGFLSTFEKHSESEDSMNELAFLMSRYKADSLLINDDFDAALTQFILIDSIYPDRINLVEAKALVNQKREMYLTYTTLQKIELDKRENKYKSKQANSKPINTLDSEGHTQNIDQKTKADKGKEVHEVDSIVKGILHIIKADGAEVDYIGEIRSNKANGYGFAVFEKKGFYEGEWSNNLRHGEGVYYWQNGDVYRGHYIEGLRDGYGIYTFATGDVYKGYWKDNLREGEGVLYNKKGEILSEGPWKQNKAESHKKKKKKKH